MQVISKVFEHLMGSSEKGLRLLVTGCKGSGKTMLLVFLAKLTHQVLKSRDPATNREVLVCDGSFGCPFLMDQLQRQFSCSDVNVFPLRS